jgi:hypothetical protein
MRHVHRDACRSGPAPTIDGLQLERQDIVRRKILGQPCGSEALELPAEKPGKHRETDADAPGAGGLVD